MQERAYDIPEWALCPITHGLLLDPVIAADGRTYERVAIERLIAENPRGPVFLPGSNIPLRHSYLIPNAEILGKIRTLCESRPALVQQLYENARLRQQLRLPRWSGRVNRPSSLSEYATLTELDQLAELEHFIEENIRLKEELTRIATSKLPTEKDTNFHLVSTLEGDLQNATDNTIYLDDTHYYILDPRIGRARKNPLPAELSVTAENLAEKLQDQTFQQKLLQDIEEKGYFLKEAFFEKLPQGVKHKMIRAIINAEPKLTLSQARSLALAGRPGISEFFQVAIGGAHFMATKLLDNVRQNVSAEADAILDQDRGLLDIKEVKLSKLFLHMLRDQPAEVQKMRKEDPDLLPEEEFKISQFLVHVSTGNLIETEKMLKEDLTLLFKKGRLVDFGLRCFTKAAKEGEPKGIYATHYAHVVKDEPMKALLKRYCPQGAEAELAKQREECRDKSNNNRKALEELGHSIETLRDALSAFMKATGKTDSHENPFYGNKEIYDLWGKVVDAQLKLATWASHLLLELGPDVAWHNATKSGLREPKSRDHELVTSMYDIIGNVQRGGGLRVALVRGRGEQCEMVKDEVAVTACADIKHDLLKISQLCLPAPAPAATNTEPTQRRMRLPHSHKK